MVLVVSSNDLSGIHKATDIVPKFTGCLSLLGSFIIQRELWCDFHNNSPSLVNNDSRSSRRTVLNRTLFSLCLADYCLTFSNMLTSLPIPHDEDQVRVWGNVGTQLTCTAQGFLFSFGLWASSVLNLHIAIVAFLIVCRGWSERQLRHVEPWIHISTWMPALVTASVPIPLNMYNPAPHLCWIHSYPFGCKESFEFGRDEADCIRGDNGSVYNLVYTIFPLWVCLLISVTLFVFIYQRVRQLEKDMSRYDFGSAMTRSPIRRCDSHGSIASTTARVHNNANCNMRSQVIAWRAIWLILSFLITYTLSFVRSFYWFCCSGFNEWLSFWNLTFYVIQGFFNLLAFMKNRPQMHTREGQWMRYILCFQWLPPRRGPSVSLSSSSSAAAASEKQPAPSPPESAIVPHESPSPVDRNDDKR